MQRAPELMAAFTVRSETASQWQTYMVGLLFLRPSDPGSQVAGHVGDPGLNQPGRHRHGDGTASREPVPDADGLGTHVVVVHQQADPVDPAQSDERRG
jgi:hypothetical protein